MKKFEQVLTNDHQMSLAGAVACGVPNLMSRGNLGQEGVPGLMTGRGRQLGQVPVELGPMHHG